MRPALPDPKTRERLHKKKKLHRPIFLMKLDAKVVNKY